MKRYSYSELQQFQNCEREYEYRMEQLLEPVFDGLPKPVGGALHVGLEHMYAGDGQAQFIAAAREKYWAELQSVVDLMTPNALSASGPEADTLRKIDGGWKVVKHLLEEYPWRDIGDILHTEATIVISMGRGREYIGKVDRIMQVNKGVWNHDTKTSGFQMEPIVKTMRLRHQFAGYHELVRTWLQGKAVVAPPVPEALAGKEPDGTIVDLLFKPRVTYRKKNKEFTGEVSVKGSQFHREPYHIGAGHINEFYDWFHTLASRIEAQGRVGPRHKNTGNCFSFNRVCSFFELCRNPSRSRFIAADETQFKQKASKHEYYG